LPTPSSFTGSSKKLGDTATPHRTMLRSSGGWQAQVALAFVYFANGITWMLTFKRLPII
jgi:hypothetical protein